MVLIKGVAVNMPFVLFVCIMGTVYSEEIMHEALGLAAEEVRGWQI